MPLPGSLSRIGAPLAEACRDVLLGRSPSAAELARDMDRAIDWAGIPAPLRPLAERLDGPMCEALAEALIDHMERIRAEVLADVRLMVLAEMHLQGQAPRA